MPACAAVIELPLAANSTNFERDRWKFSHPQPLSNSFKKIHVNTFIIVRSVRKADNITF